MNITCKGLSKKLPWTIGFVTTTPEDKTKKVLRYMSTFSYTAENAVKEIVYSYMNDSKMFAGPDEPIALACVKHGVMGSEEGLSDVEMSFGDALFMMKMGCFVARKGWNGKSMYLWLLEGTTIKKSWVHDPALLEAFGDRDEIECLPSIRMFTADKKVLTGWLASQTDLQANDWVIVKYPEDESKYSFGS